MKSEAAQHADFSAVRYAQCWEDADILVDALNIREGQTVLSIASAGDNTFSLLSQNPEKVYAVDLNPAQLACVDIRRAAYMELEYEEFLQLLGIVESADRRKIYTKIKGAMLKESRSFWDNHINEIDAGIGHAGKFERYFKMFRERIIPLIHSKRDVEMLLAGGTELEREKFYNKVWNNLRWKLLFKLFFSRHVMGSLGRDPSFFRYVDGSVSERIMARTKYALTKLDTAQNPYLHWILKGNYGNALPHALRRENYGKIQSNIHKLEIRLQSVEDFVEQMGHSTIDAFNLSDIFEYMSQSETDKIFELIYRSSRNNGRVAYWNMLAPRQSPEHLSGVVYLEELSKKLFLQDKAFFYSAFRIEEIRKGKEGI